MFSSSFSSQFDDSKKTVVSAIPWTRHQHTFHKEAEARLMKQESQEWQENQRKCLQKQKLVKENRQKIQDALLTKIHNQKGTNDMEDSSNNITAVSSGQESSLNCGEDMTNGSTAEMSSINANESSRTTTATVEEGDSAANCDDSFLDDLTGCLLYTSPSPRDS